MNSNIFRKRLTYTKYIYEQGMELLAKKTSISNAMAILNFHDASEQFLLIIADKLRFKPPNKYMNYWIEARKKGETLPNENDMFKLNKMRVSFKHHGILPTFDDCKDIQYKLQFFFVTVSKAILDEDYLKLSLADLIEYEDIKKYIKNAEKYLEQEIFEKSIIESAKAFALFEKRAEGDVCHSHILKEEPFGRFIEDETIFKALDEIKNRLNSITENLNVLILGLDSFKYQKFKLLTPHISISMTGKIIGGGIGGAFRNILNLNEENAQFCINFIIDSVLKFQENPIGLFNSNKLQTIKIKNPYTKIYIHKEKIFKEIGMISKDIIFENAKLTLLLEKKENYWRVDYEGEEAFIKMKDVDWIEETKQPFLYGKK